MAKVRTIRCASACRLNGVTARLLLFAGLIAIALVHAWPDRTEERGLIEVGHRLCEASVNGTPINPRWPSPRETVAFRLTGLIENLPRYLRRLRPVFSEGCNVRFWRGRLEPDNDTDYVLMLTGPNGNHVIMNLKARGFFPNFIFEVKDLGASWTICDPC